MRAKRKDEKPAEMPDWLLTDVGLRRSDLPRRRQWFSDILVDYGPGSPARGWGWDPTWRRE